MTARQIIVPGAMPSRDRNGRALPGKLRFYSPDTTTPATVYTSSALSVAHSFPILSDSAGRWPAIWANSTDSFDVAWSDQTFDALIASYSGVSPADDAVLASVALAEAAADTAVANGTTDNAVASAASAAAAATSATAAAGSATSASSSVTAAAGSATAAAGSATAAAASAASAAAIVGFDPTTRTVTGGGLATGGGTLAANRVITVTKSSQAQAQAGTDDATAMTPVRVADAIAALAIAAIPVAPNVIVQNQQTSGTGSGSFTGSGTRPLNTTVRNASSLAALASDTVTIPAGTYYIEAWAAFAGIGTPLAARIEILNSTDSTVVGVGGPISCTATESGGGISRAAAVVTIAGSKGFKLTDRASANIALSRGAALSGGSVEVYAEMKIWKVG